MSEYTKNQIDMGLSALSLFHYPVITDIWYQNREVKLDGYRFVHCRFDNCRLIVSGNHFKLERCLIDPKTTINYMGDTNRIIKLFLARWDWAYQNLQGFVPTRHDDDTITIE